MCSYNVVYQNTTFGLVDYGKFVELITLFTFYNSH